MSDLDQAIAPLALGDDDDLCEWYRRPDLGEQASSRLQAGRAVLGESGLCGECVSFIQVTVLMGARSDSHKSHHQKGDMGGDFFTRSTILDTLRGGYTFQKPYSQIRGDADFCALCRAIEDSVAMTQKYATGCHGTHISPGSHVWLHRWVDYHEHVVRFIVREGETFALPEHGYLEVQVRETEPVEAGANLSSSDAIKGHETVTINGARFRTGVPCRDMTQMLRSWLRECDSGHDVCRDHKNAAQSSTDVDTSASPTRLLEIQRVDGRFHVRLVAGSENRARYTALSHRWGDYSSIRTTTLNIESYWNEISFDSLSLTLQQAIQITFAAGVHHIWIDCLCIIQDDDSDWAMEAPKMGSIYASAYFTIAASAFEDKGCFPVKFAEDHRVTIDVHPGFELKIFPRSYDLSTRSSSMYNEPLQKRGWTLQERLLSQRILYCSQSEYYWLCRKQRLRAWGGRGLEASEDFFWRTLTPGPSGRDTLLLSHSTRSQRDALSKWYALLFDYSNRQVTLEKDKLIAINGLVDIFQRWIGSRYLHGLWECDLACGLVWQIELSDSGSGRGVNTHKLRPTRAPSWSWASVDGPQSHEGVRFPSLAENMRQPISEFVHVQVTVASDDEHRYYLGGEIPEGPPRILKISGRLSKAFYGYKNADGQGNRVWQIKYKGGPRTFEFVADDPDFDTDEHIGDTERSRLYVLPVVATMGLVISPASGDDVPLYRRIGTCEFPEPEYWYSEDSTTGTAEGDNEHATVQTDDSVTEALDSENKTDDEAFDEDVGSVNKTDDDAFDEDIDSPNKTDDEAFDEDVDSVNKTDDEAFDEDVDSANKIDDEAFDGDIDAASYTESESGSTEISIKSAGMSDDAVESSMEGYVGYVDRFGWIWKVGASETIFLC